MPNDLSIEDVPSDQHATCRKHFERTLILEHDVNELKSNQEKIIEMLQGVKDEMTKYKGFLGGIAFITSGLLVFVTLLKDWFFNHWK